jgi:hypothetical protein
MQGSEIPKSRFATEIWMLESSSNLCETECLCKREGVNYGLKSNHIKPSTHQTYHVTTPESGI